VTTPQSRRALQSRFPTQAAPPKPFMAFANCNAAPLFTPVLPPMPATSVSSREEISRFSHEQDLHSSLSSLRGQLMANASPPFQVTAVNEAWLELTKTMRHDVTSSNLLEWFVLSRQSDLKDIVTRVLRIPGSQVELQVGIDHADAGSKVVVRMDAVRRGDAYFILVTHVCNVPRITPNLEPTISSIKACTLTPQTPQTPQSPRLRNSRDQQHTTQSNHDWYHQRQSKEVSRLPWGGVISHPDITGWESTESDTDESLETFQTTSNPLRRAGAVTPCTPRITSSHMRMRF